MIMFSIVCVFYLDNGSQFGVPHFLRLLCSLLQPNECVLLFLAFFSNVILSDRF